MTDRNDLIDRFLAAQGWGNAKRVPLAGDASFRRYERIVEDSRHAVLMDAPPSHENVRPYIAVATILRKAGYSAPEIYAQDVANGLLLIEDLGDDTYTRVLARDPGKEHDLYALAVDLLADLRRRDAASVTSGIPDYDDERLLTEASLLVDWFLPAMRREPTAPALRQEYLDLWRPLFPIVRKCPDTLVLRDYHVDNLMWLPKRPGIQSVGLLDFQDAVRGSPAYDLVSLLEDARRDIAPALVAEMKARYLGASGTLDRDAFGASYAVLGAQRNAKIIGIFTRLAVRDKKPIYLGHIPRVWRLLEGDLEHPALRPIADWLTRHIPAAHRGIPPVESAA